MEQLVAPTTTRRRRTHSLSLHTPLPGQQPCTGTLTRQPVTPITGSTSALSLSPPLYTSSQVQGIAPFDSSTAVRFISQLSADSDGVTCAFSWFVTAELPTEVYT